MYGWEIEEVNGQAALIIRAGGQAFSVLTIEIEDGQIQTIRVIANPEKLARVRRETKELQNTDITISYSTEGLARKRA